MALILVVVDALLNVAEYGLGYSSLSGLVQLFDLNRERNLPTWYSSILLAFVALLLVDAAPAERLRGGRHFHRLAFLALVFGYLSIDESVSLHERLIPVLQVAVGAVVVLSVALCCAGWLRDVPVAIRRRMLVAGGLYVGGALGVDAVGAVIFQFGAGLLYAMTTTLEEGLELIGVTLFIESLLRLRTRWSSLEPSREPTEPPAWQTEPVQ